jgi:translation initiation factor IF-1
MPKPSESVTRVATVISKSLSGSDFILSLEDGGRAHNVYLTKDEQTRFQLGDKVTLSLTKITL